MNTKKFILIFFILLNANCSTLSNRTNPLMNSANENTTYIEALKTLSCPLIHWDCIQWNRFLKKTNIESEIKPLLEEANLLLNTKPLSILDKKEIPPSYDPHDYLSLATYYWPSNQLSPLDPNAIYINKDGVLNPEIKHFGDRTAFYRTVEHIEILGLAYYFTKNKQYSKKATELIRKWFLDSKTQMNPHFEYSQIQPGLIMKGNRSGMIEGRELIYVINTANLLKGSESWSDNDESQLKNWFSKLLNWYLTSDAGKKEKVSKNNHGSWYDLQLIAFSLYTDHSQIFEEVIHSSLESRIQSQIDPDGSQKEELKRTRPWQYSTMNLDALFGIALIIEQKKHLNSFEKYPRLKDAFNYLIPYAEGQKKWITPDIDPFHPELLNSAKNVLSLRYENTEFNKINLDYQNSKIKNFFSKIGKLNQ